MRFEMSKILKGISHASRMHQHFKGNNSCFSDSAKFKRTIPCDSDSAKCLDADHDHCLKDCVDR
jgi:hypothetical protein